MLELMQTHHTLHSTHNRRPIHPPAIEPTMTPNPTQQPPRLKPLPPTTAAHAHAHAQMQAQQQQQMAAGVLLVRAVCCGDVAEVGGSWID